MKGIEISVNGKLLETGTYELRCTDTYYPVGGRGYIETEVTITGTYEPITMDDTIRVWVFGIELDVLGVVSHTRNFEVHHRITWDCDIRVQFKRGGK